MTLHILILFALKASIVLSVFAIGLNSEPTTLPTSSADPHSLRDRCSRWTSSCLWSRRRL